VGESSGSLITNLNFLPNADFLSSGFKRKTSSLERSEEAQGVLACRSSSLFGIEFYCGRVGELQCARIGGGKQAGFLSVGLGVMTKSR
jgi:hypothetical protein